MAEQQIQNSISLLKGNIADGDIVRNGDISVFCKKLKFCGIFLLCHRLISVQEIRWPAKERRNTL
jgi:hypothetical protein